MFDIETKVFNEIATELRSKYNGITIYGEYVNAPSKFPCVTIIEQDNYTAIEGLTLTNVEEASNLMYEINVYSNKKNGKKQESKSIISTIDTIMLGMGFIRTMLNPIPNLNEATIYRIVARYKKIETGGN